MAEYPYTPKASSLDPLFERIQTTGVPNKVTLKYIESLGFKSKSDRYLLPLLRTLGFLDSHGVPTDRWKKYRNKKQAVAEMAQALREAYAGLFAMYPDAHRKDAEALRNFFTSNTSVGETAVQMMVGTFKALVNMADFESSALASETPIVPSEAAADLTPVPVAAAVPIAKSSTATTQGITVNLNIQLTLPESKDSSIYDTLFESLKKHLLS